MAHGGFLFVKSQKYLEKLCTRLEASCEHVGEREQELRVIDMNVTIFTQTGEAWERGCITCKLQGCPSFTLEGKKYPVKARE